MQRLLRLRQEMAQRYMAQYGPPSQYPPQIAQQYGPGLEKSARMWVQEVMRREREAQQQQQRASQAAAQIGYYSTEHFAIALFASWEHDISILVHCNRSDY